jgi:NDP-sugar pyrophosphorylase family protein
VIVILLFQKGAIMDEEVIIQNSFVAEGCSIGQGSVISNCYLTNHIHIGANCLLSGINTNNMSVGTWNMINIIYAKENSYFITKVIHVIME